MNLKGCISSQSYFTVGIYLYLLHKLHNEVKEERMVGVGPM